MYTRHVNFFIIAESGSNGIFPCHEAMEFRSKNFW
jgi:hypothetical protein